MADIADLADRQIEQTLQHGLQDIRRYRGESATHCEECAAEIPQARRVAVPGCRLCVECQEIEDRRGRA